MGSLNAWFASVNWANPSWDIFIFVFFIVGSILYGLSLGRDRVVTVLLSIYTSLAVVTNAPLLSPIIQKLNPSANPYLRISCFLVAFLLVFFLTSRSPLLRNSRLNMTTGSIWQSVVFGILEIGLLLSIILTFLPPESTNGLAQLTKDMFLSDRARSIWLIAPLLLLGITSLHRRETVDI